jgi:hypothetical protein
VSLDDDDDDDDVHVIEKGCGGPTRQHDNAAAGKPIIVRIEFASTGRQRMATTVEDEICACYCICLPMAVPNTELQLGNGCRLACNGDGRQQSMHCNCQSRQHWMAQLSPWTDS